MAQGVKGTGKSRLANALKKVKFPKPGEMVSTTTALCSCCEYGKTIGGNALCICDYYLMTGKMRGCKVGECDKFQKLLAKKKPKLPG